MGCRSASAQKSADASRCSNVFTFICEALDRDGEIFIIKTKDKKGNPKFQIIEAHRVETPPDAMSLPDIFDGIRFE